MNLLNWSIGESSIDKGTFYISDPLSEMIFGSMLGHLYDLGVVPSLQSILERTCAKMKKQVL